MAALGVGGGGAAGAFWILVGGPRGRVAGFILVWFGGLGLACVVGVAVPRLGCAAGWLLACVAGFILVFAAGFILAFSVLAGLVLALGGVAVPRLQCAAGWRLAYVAGLVLVSAAGFILLFSVAGLVLVFAAGFILASLVAGLVLALSDVGWWLCPVVGGTWTAQADAAVVWDGAVMEPVVSVLSGLVGSGRRRAVPSPLAAASRPWSLVTGQVVWQGELQGGPAAAVAGVEHLAPEELRWVLPEGVAAWSPSGQADFAWEGELAVGQDRPVVSLLVDAAVGRGAPHN